MIILIIQHLQPVQVCCNYDQWKETHILTAFPWTFGEDEYIKIKVSLSLWTRTP